MFKKLCVAVLSVFIAVAMVLGVHALGVHADGSNGSRLNMVTLCDMAPVEELL